MSAGSSRSGGSPTSRSGTTSGSTPPTSRPGSTSRGCRWRRGDRKGRAARVRLSHVHTAKGERHRVPRGVSLRRSKSAIRRGFGTGRRRKVGEAVSSIRKKPSGRYEARYRDPGGRLRGKTFRTKREAQEFLDRTGTSIGDGAWRDPALAKVRLAEYTTWWLENRPELRRGPASSTGPAPPPHRAPPG